MNKTTRRLMSLLLAFVMAFAPLSAAAADLDEAQPEAAEPVIEEVVIEEVEIAPETQEPVAEEPEEPAEPAQEPEAPAEDSTLLSEGVKLHLVPDVTDVTNDDLLLGYFQKTAGMEPEDLSLTAMDNFLPTGNALTVYGYLSEAILHVAEFGGATEFYFPYVDITEQDVWDVFYAILNNMPFELYWFDKEKGMNIEYSDGRLYAWMLVNEAYQNGSQFSVSPYMASRANNAGRNAREMVNHYASYGDYAKLVAYRDEILRLVSYDYDALDPNTPYGDPWQVIHCFDGDPDTNIVCEGYSKAFKMLCDMSNWNEDISCDLAEGDVIFGNGTGGAHMWNTVHINGMNFLTDLTNCDGTGDPGVLFLVGGAMTTIEGYRTVSVKWFDETWLFVYSEYLADYYTNGQLEIAPYDYDPNVASVSIINIDRTNNQSIKITFSDSVVGGADKNNYRITNSNGDAVSVSSATSMGGNVYRLNFADPLPADAYTIRFSNSGRNVYQVFHISLDLKVYKIVDDRNVIIQLNEPIFGCTTASNYEFHTLSGQVISITSAVSAYNEIGGAAPNVFRLTTDRALSAGTTYVVETRQMSLDAAGNYPCQGTIAYFTPSASDLAGGVDVTVTALTNNQSIKIQLPKTVSGASVADNYIITNQFGDRVTVGNVQSIGYNAYEINFSDPLRAGHYTIYSQNMSATLRGGFDITLDLSILHIENNSVIIQLNEPIYGCTTPSNYFVHKLGSNEEITAVDAYSVFTELGCAIPNVFRIVLPQWIVPGQTYIIETRAMALDPNWNQPCQGTIAYFTK